MKCNICNGQDFIRIHQIGVINCVKVEKGPEPEAMFDLLICKTCGNTKVDVETIEIKTGYSIWPAKY